jgi:hypothetical protein
MAIFIAGELFEKQMEVVVSGETPLQSRN